MLHLPWIHSGLDPSVRELGDTLCLPDYLADIDPGPGKYFPRPGSRLVNPILLVNCVPDLERCLLESEVLPNVPGFVINYGSGPEELPPGDSEVLSGCNGRIDMIKHEGLPGRHGTWRKLSDSYNDLERWY